MSPGSAVALAAAPYGYPKGLTSLGISHPQLLVFSEEIIGAMKSQDLPKPR